MNNQVAINIAKAVLARAVESGILDLSKGEVNELLVKVRQVDRDLWSALDNTI